jgi:flavin reductase (DIM6/NTAB) family NADH-FMN oxidoreductase RutF
MSAVLTIATSDHSVGMLTATVDSERFRAVMRSVCSPVAVVTAFAGDRPHGTTVSAFASLSMDPPMMLVSLDRSSELLKHVRRSRRFGLNVLSSEQRDLAVTFARKGTNKFSGVAWTLDERLPRLPNTVGWVACTVERLVRGGDHILVLGNVISAGHAVAAPLTYHGRVFGTHAALATRPA